MVNEFGIDSDKYTLSTYEGDDAVHSAIRGDYLNVLSLLLRTKRLTNSKNDAGVTPLHLAASYDSIEVVSFVLRHVENTNPNALDNEDNTPLHIAVFYNNDNTVDELLKAGANPGIQNKAGITPISIAESQGFEELAKKLETFEQNPSSEIKQPCCSNFQRCQIS
ncbi:ankyrin repeat domain-containing protein [Wolbachia endosymbiont of Folsomia candida]|uniref:ankyrin repeat domain-containing protein n=1 Tax=Wolbachia endosymbiont of Folsomia candida TaxID=169402 RepID=UPI000A4520AF|nr:ankyrin repeat domain-containing protein [Wolbachia endosymbiont of Folsomia candida]APR98862.1 hypothetical protein ASM33_06600 [Wolbachia endosymbiont of Folsomia candida]